MFNEECRIPGLRQLFKSVTDTVFSGFNVSLVPKDLTVKRDASDDDIANNTPFGSQFIKCYRAYTYL